MPQEVNNPFGKVVVARTYGAKLFRSSFFKYYLKVLNSVPVGTAP